MRIMMKKVGTGVYIEPLVGTQQSRIIASDRQLYDGFGNSSCMSGDGNTVIVGAYEEDTGGNYAGSVYVFTRSGETWTEQAKIQSDDIQGEDRFGYSVSMSYDGNTAIVGAHSEDTGYSGAGAAYIFTRSGGVWTQQDKIQASDKLPSDSFGYSVSISSDGNTAIIGAYHDDGPAGTEQGSAYIFVRAGSVWTEQQRIRANIPSPSDYFGGAVDISSDGNTVVIGAFRHNSYTGFAEVFTRNGTVWSYQQRLEASDQQINNYFGYNVTISGDGKTIAIGNTIIYGSVYIFNLVDATWVEEIRIRASDFTIAHNFSSGVDLSSNGNVLVVGAMSDTTYGPSAGAAYIFTRGGGVWTEQQKIYPTTGILTEDQFGRSVSISDNGSTAIIGASGEGKGDIRYAGAAYIFV